MARWGHGAMLVCGSRDFRLLQGKEHVAICDQCVAFYAWGCELNFGPDWNPHKVPSGED